MPDPVIARNTSAFTPIPEGDYTAVCVDVIDLGQHLNEKYAQVQPKCALVFQLADERGQRHELAERFTVSMGEKARLRKFLEQWRGRPYAAQQLADGVPLDKLTGQNAVITVVHNRSGDKVYANAFSIRPLGKADTRIAPTNYTRADYWATVVARAIPQADPDIEGADNVAGMLGDVDDDLPF